MQITSWILAALVSLSPPDKVDLPRLKPGEPVEGEIAKTDPEVHSPVLDSKGYVADGRPARGKTYVVEVAESGVYRIELRSYLFDAYLVLRDAEGNVLAEDDDALNSTHSRIVHELAPGRGYRLDVCALREGTGPCELADEEPQTCLEARLRRADPGASDTGSY